MSLSYWIYVLLIGLLAGWLAGQIMKGRSFGLVGNIIVGVVAGQLLIQCAWIGGVWHHRFHYYGNRRCDRVVIPRRFCEETLELDILSHLEPVPHEPSGVDFQHVRHGFGREVTLVFIQRLHALNVDNAPVRIDEGNVQGNKSVAHPKGLRARMFKHEQHALLFRQLLAKHQAAHPFFIGLDDLDAQGHLANHDLRQMLRGLLLSFRFRVLGLFLGSTATTGRNEKNGE